jgi:hypothetical protein
MESLSRRLGSAAAVLTALLLIAAATVHIYAEDAVVTKDGKGSCRAKLPGDQETVDVTVVGGRPVALSSRFDDQSLLPCPPGL